MTITGTSVGLRFFAAFSHETSERARATISSRVRSKSRETLWTFLGRTLRKNNEPLLANSADCRHWPAESGSDADGRSRQMLSVPLTSEQLGLLERLVANTVVPRLLLGSRTESETQASALRTLTPVTLEHVGEFAELVISRDIIESTRYFEAMRANGATVEVLFQDLLAPVARRLGELWDEDINDFIDVTRGVAQLQQIVRDYSVAFHSEARQPIANRRALLMPMPGEQHNFGIAVVGEHFRRAGWHVWGGPPHSLEDVLELVGGQWFDVIGLSVSRLDNTLQLSADIARIRQRSLNRTALVQIGGKPFTDNPALVASVGADATAIDGRQAVLQISAMIERSGETAAV